MEWTRDPRTVDRFWARVHKTESCWLWLKADGTVIPRYGHLRYLSSNGTRHCKACRKLAKTPAKRDELDRNRRM